MGWWSEELPCLRPGVVSWQDVMDIEGSWAVIDCGLLLLDSGHGTVEDRAVRARNTGFLAYASRRFGPGEDRLIGHFVGERDRFREFVGACQMRNLVLCAEASENELAAA